MPEEAAPVIEPVSEPAAETQSEPVIDSPAAPTAEPDVTDTEAAPTEASEVSTEASPEASDDDPFAEFESGPKDKDSYEELFKTEKWKHVPHTARDEIRKLADERDAAEGALSEIGGPAVLATFKPTFDAVLSPDPTREQVEAAFEAIDQHNPKVMEQLGAGFTENWVQQVIADPVTNLSPLVTHVAQQIFGPAGANYDLNKILEFIQLDLARDSNGDPLLDLESARELFNVNGGFNAFRAQQEKAQYEKRIEELTNGYPARQTAPTQAQPQATFDVDSDLEAEILPKFEGVLTKLGYAKDDPETSFILDAMKYRLRTAQETGRIHGFAKSGAYKGANGEYVQGVKSNKEYLEKRLYASLINEMKAFQAKRKGVPSPPKAPIVKDPVQPTAQSAAPVAKPPVTAQKPKGDRDAFIADVATRFKAKMREEEQARAIGAGQ